jgi:hypothetical protein
VVIMPRNRLTYELHSAQVLPPLTPAATDLMLVLRDTTASGEGLEIRMKLPAKLAMALRNCIEVHRLGGDYDVVEPAALRNPIEAVL